MDKAILSENANATGKAVPEDTAFFACNGVASRPAIQGDRRIKEPRIHGSFGRVSGLGGTLTVAVTLACCAGAKYNADGSLDIYVQAKSPGQT